MSKAKCLALAKRLYGPKAFLEERPKALTAPAKDALRELRRQQSARMADIKEQLAAFKAQPWAKLTAAARFAVDVDGGEPSLTQLREAVEQAERYAALTAEKAELFQSLRSTEGNMLSHRCNVLKSLGWANESVGWADTWAEMLKKLEAKAELQCA